MSQKMVTYTVTRRARQGRPVPEDLELLYKTMTQKELAAHYGVSVSTIARWLKKAGYRKFA